MDRAPTYVTRPFLPPRAEFDARVDAMWESRQLTNAGPFHAELERELAAWLGVEHLALFTNGTVALLTALQALRVTGEVITTPYSFVATAHALLWNNLTPVFADIDAASCNLDPARVAAAVTPRTTAILPVHCYGGPCDHEGLAAVAGAHGLKILYDAAHAFAVRREGRSVLNEGDLAVLSFHATKVFHTFEGGAIVCPDAETKQRIDYLKNFGFADEVTVVGPGINGKMSEIQAIMGLTQLPYMDELIAARGRVAAAYRQGLAEVAGLEMLAPQPGVAANHSYFPIFVGPAYGADRDWLYDRLKAEGIFARRYFYPLISDMPVYRDLPSASPQNLPNAQVAAERVLCLPIYPDLPEDDLARIIEIVRRGR